MSGPASATWPAGSGAIRGCRRQWSSAPPVALQSGKCRRPAGRIFNLKFGQGGGAPGRKGANGKLNNPGKIRARWGGARLCWGANSWDVQKGPDPPKFSVVLTGNSSLRQPEEYEAWYEAAAHRGAMPRRELVGDLGPPASLAARGCGPAPPGGGCEGRRRASLSRSIIIMPRQNRRVGSSCTSPNSVYTTVYNLNRSEKSVVRGCVH